MSGIEMLRDVAMRMRSHLQTRNNIFGADPKYSTKKQTSQDKIKNALPFPFVIFLYILFEARAGICPRTKRNALAPCTCAHGMPAACAACALHATHA